MNRAFVILMGIAAVGIGSYVAFGDVARPPSGAATAARPVADDRAERSGDDPASSAKEAAALRAGMARLNAEVSALREQVVASQASANADAPAMDPEPARGDPAQRAQQESEWHAHMMEVDANFQSEVLDPRWASSTTSALQSALNASDALRGKMQDVECRSQTCRVEIADDGSGAVSKDLPLFVQQVGGTLPSMQADRIDEGDGQSTLVLYMTRNAGAQSPTAEMSRR